MPRQHDQRNYSRDQILRIAQVGERQFKSWERLGFVRVATEYHWPDLVAAQTLAKLSKAGFGPKRIRRAIEEIQNKLRDVKNPLSELHVAVEHGRVHVLVDGQRMEAGSGQLLLNFDTDQVSRLLAFPIEKQNAREQKEKVRRAGEWFQRGLEMEQSGVPIEQAVEAYDKALELDPHCLGALVNLGTIYFQVHDYRKAESYYKRALEAEPEYALAHFNLGNLYDERSDFPAAQHHYLAALRITPNYADAHYNFALLCQRTGQGMKAVRHWRAYLKLDPSSSWAEIARRELAKLRDAAVVKGESGSGRPRVVSE